MKKLLFILIACLSVTVSAFAGSKLKVTSGNMSSLKSEDAQVLVSVDLSKCRWEKDEDFKTWCGNDYETRVNSAAPSFAKGYNDEAEGKLRFVTSGSAKYAAVFTVTNMERKQGMGAWGSCYIRLYGTIVITEAATGKAVCTIAVNGQKGDTDFVENDRLAKSFVGVGEELAEIK